MKEIDFDKLQEEFERALADHDPGTGPRGLTSYEWAKIWGTSQPTAATHIRIYIERGIMEFVGRAQRKNIDGVKRRIPVYAPVSIGKDSTFRKITESDK